MRLNENGGPRLYGCKCVAAGPLLKRSGSAGTGLHVAGGRRALCEDAEGRVGEQAPAQLSVHRSLAAKANSYGLRIQDTGPCNAASWRAARACSVVLVSCCAIQPAMF